MGQNSGITKTCPNPECKKILISGANFLGLNIFKIKCPECKTKWIFEITQKTIVKITKATLFLIMIVGAFAFYKAIKAKQGITCDSFKTYEDAKALFDSDKVKYKSLDKNHNDKPCEDLII